jgi:hypothetical protein
MRFLKKLAQLALVLAAMVLTVANSAAPEVKDEVVPTRVEGTLPVELDRCAYPDKGFEVRLPPGKHRSLTVAGVSSTVVFELKEGDQRLVSAPASIEILPRGRVQDGSYRLTLVEADGTRTVYTFAIGRPR